MLGVSPAYFVSIFGVDFGPQETATGLDALRRIGYRSFQAEVFNPEALGLWTPSSIRELRAAAADAGLACGAFVAHFLGRPMAELGYARVLELMDQAERSLAAAAELGCRGPWALPLIPSRAGTEAQALEALLSALAERCAAYGFGLCIELLPGNALGGLAEFIGLASKPGLEALTLLLDTGHLWVMGEDMGRLPDGLAGKIGAVHLCDNDGVENLSLPPGRGTIPFSRFIPELRRLGFDAPLDIEVVCPADQAISAYTEAFEAVSSIVRRRGDRIPA